MTGKLENKPLFVGINPTKAQYRKGCAFFRLMEWIELMDLGIVAFTNISHDPHWNKRAVDPHFLLASVREHTKVIALGGLVSDTLSKLNIEHYTLPHPSPLNRQINNPDFIRKKLEESRNYLK
jgi:hypothetical protein